MSDKMKLWKEVCETDPGTTKEVSFGRKFTAIDAYAQIKRATEIFGPYGSQWGLSDITHIFLPDQPMVLVKAKFHYSGETFIGEFDVTSSIAYTNKKGIDDDFAKKVETDLITKALSRLGFNADVFMGKFDDNRYVQAMKEKFSQVSPEPIDTGKVDAAVDNFKELIDRDNPEETHEGIKIIFQRLTNDEKVEVGKMLSMKAPDSNKMYKTLLKDHLNYKGEMK